MIAKLVDSESSLSGKKLQINNPIGNFISTGKITDGLLFDEEFSKRLNKDKQALNHYMEAVNKTGDIQNSLDMYMSGASENAQNHAKSIEIVSGQITNADEVIANYTKSANMAQVSNLALDKSFANCQKIINEFNGGFKNTKLSQEEFVSAVGASNNVVSQIQNEAS